MADLDGDGRLDFVNGRYSPANVYWFRGVDGGVAPREVLLASADGDKSSMATTNLGDLDGDGLVDLVIGDTSGRVDWARNVGTRTAPRFTAREGLRSSGRPLRVCHKSDPIAVDWDGDGRIDLLVGDETADVSFFRGRADGSFEAGVSLFSGLSVDPGDNYTKAKAKLDPHRVIPGYRVRLAVDDWNDDGKLDLLVGNCIEGGSPGSDEKTKKPLRGPTIGHVWVLLRRWSSCSSHAPNPSRARSAPRGPQHWMPIGRPPSLVAIGIASAGPPPAFIGTQNADMASE